MERAKIRAPWLVALLALFVAAMAPMPRAQAATYYVRNDGNDDNDGLSHDSAWRTLDKVNSRRFEAGDRVLFLEGGRWAGQIIVDWGGSASSPAVLGAYHLEHGIPRRGYVTARPVIDGTDTIPQQFDGLIRVKAPYVRVENIAVINSEGRGIQFEDSDHGVVAGCETRNSYKSGIKFVRSDDALIERNFVTRAGVALPEDGGVWGGAIELVASNDGKVRGNTVFEVYGEGINANHGASRSVIEDNFVLGARAVGIYVDAAPATSVRRNMVLGTSNPEFWRTASSTGAGIALNNEAYHYSVNGGDLPSSVQSTSVAVYENLVAGTSSGIGIWGQFEQSSFDDTLIFNNTLVDNETQLVLRDKPRPGAWLVNNVLLSLSAGTRDVEGSALLGMQATTNYFSQGDPGGDFTGATSFYKGLRLARASGWRNADSVDSITWRDFQLDPSSVLIGKGDDRPRVMSQGDNTFDIDFNRLPHNAAMDLGALHFSLEPIRTPEKPARVRARP